MNKLSEHFTLEEMCHSQTAVRHGLSNRPGARETEALRQLCIYVLDPIRRAARRPVIVSSGYRSATVNRLVGGRRGSQHIKGQAADIIVPGMEVFEVVRLIRKLDIDCDQVIDEFGQWTHVSFRVDAPNRWQFLMARREGGAVVYKPLYKED